MPSTELDYVAGANLAYLEQRDDDTKFEPLLIRYIEGWAEVNILKIVASVSEDYLFVDPLVGVFSRGSLPTYIQILRERVGFDSVRLIRTKVYLGAIRSPASPLNWRFWRSLPECGLAGTSDVQLRAGRVVRDLVSYDPNIATEQLRCSS